MNDERCRHPTALANGQTASVTVWESIPNTTMRRKALTKYCGLVGDGITVRTLVLRSRCCGFDSRSGRYQVVSIWIGDCQKTGKQSLCIDPKQHQGQLSFLFFFRDRNRVPV